MHLISVLIFRGGNVRPACLSLALDCVWYGMNIIFQFDINLILGRCFINMYWQYTTL